MNEQHPISEAPREYGELYYSADTIRAILRLVAESLEAGQRDALPSVSFSIPSTMSWDGPSKDVQQSTYFPAVCRDVQLGLEYVSVLGSGTLRLNALLRRGPVSQPMVDREHVTGVVDKQQDATKRLFAELGAIREALGVPNRS